MTDEEITRAEKIQEELSGDALIPEVWADDNGERAAKLQAIIRRCQLTVDNTSAQSADRAAAACTISGIRLAMNTVSRSWQCDGSGEAVQLYSKAHASATTYLIFVLNHWKALV